LWVDGTAAFLLKFQTAPRTGFEGLARQLICDIRKLKRIAERSTLVDPEGMREDGSLCQSI